MHILDEIRLNYLIEQLEGKMDGKVDKEAGKGLSTNDFTDVEKNKLEGKADKTYVDSQDDLKVDKVEHEALDTKVTSHLADYESLIEDISDLTQFLVPSGLISMWSGLLTAVPEGWALCDGDNGTPDLQDRFIVGAGGSYQTGDVGGESEVELTTRNLPVHTHSSGSMTTSIDGDHSHSANTDSGGLHNHSSGTLSTSTTGAHTHTYSRRSASPTQQTTPGSSHGIGLFSTNTGSAGSHSHSISGNVSTSGSHIHSVTMDTSGSHSHSVYGITGSTGEGTAHENRPPYFALAFIMKL